MLEQNRMTLAFRDIPSFSVTEGKSPNYHLLEFGDFLENISIDIICL